MRARLRTMQRRGGRAREPHTIHFQEPGAPDKQTQVDFLSYTKEFIEAVLDSNQARASLPKNHFRAFKEIINDPRSFSHHHGTKMLEVPGIYGLLYLRGATCAAQTVASSSMAGIDIYNRLSPAGQGGHSSPSSNAHSSVVAGPGHSVCQSPLHSARPFNDAGN